MSRMHALVTALGVLLVLWGLLAKGWPFEIAEGPGAERAAVLANEPPADEGFDGALGRTDASRETSRGGAESDGGSASPIEVAFRVVHLEDGTPAPEALVELWRVATGQGVTYRPSRRLVMASELALGRDGHGVLEVPPDVGVELVARAVQRGEPTVIPLGVLRRSPDPLVVIVERPPEPVDLVVVDAGGAAVPGANCALGVAGERAAFPGRVLIRTDGKGRATLPGAARKVGHLLVDAPGYGPAAVRSETLADVTGAHRIELAPAAILEVTVPDAGDGLHVEVDFTLEGFPARRTALVDRRGRAVVRGLPPRIPLVARVVTASGYVGDVPAFELAPEETRALSITAPRAGQ